MSSTPGHPLGHDTLAGHADRRYTRDLPVGRRASAAADRLLKRFLDVIVATVALVLMVPLLAVVALTVKVTSPGPVLFRHERLGRNGAKFTCLKFRTMVENAETILQELLDEDPELRRRFEMDYKLPSDPRVTGVGRWLRRTSLDELPQFWNVLRGEMSVVGPRPIVTEELAKYGDWGTVLLSVRPGITGSWQVSGRNDIDYADRVALDVHYVRDRSFWGDVAIILRTVRVMFAVGSNGAY